MRFLGTIVAGGLVALAQSAAACDRPEPFASPFGDSVTEEDMIVAGTAYREFMAGMVEYQSCIEAESDTQRRRLFSSDATNDEVLANEAAFVLLHNESSDEMAHFSQSFQDAVDAFLAGGDRPPDPDGEG